jgi:DNA polymerase delta subunit 3
MARILQEFYHHEITKSPGSVHATYLVAGILKSVHSVDARRHGLVDDEENPMQSSPFMSSSAPLEIDVETQATIMVMSLVNEDHLQSEPLLSAANGACADYIFRSQGEIPEYFVHPHI